MNVAEKWDGAHAGDRHRAGHLGGARAARRGRARRRAGAGPLQRCSTARPASRQLERALARGDAASISWRRHARRCALARPRSAPRDRLRVRDHRPGGLPPLRPPGHRARPPSRTRRCYALRGGRARSARSYNLLLDAAAPSARTSRRWCSCTRTSRSPTRTSAPRSARRCAIPRWPWSGCVGADRRPRASRGGRARCSAAAVAPALPASTAAARLPAFSWAEPRAGPGRGGHRRRLAAGALALGRAQRALRRGADARPRLRPRLLPAGPGRRAAGSMTADLRVVHHRPLELIDDLDLWIEAHIQARREVGGPHAGRRSRAAGLEGARPPGRGRARGGADDRLLRQPSRPTRALLELERRLEETHGEPRRGA